jgi:hypothetical protein
MPVSEAASSTGRRFSTGGPSTRSTSHPRKARLTTSSTFLPWGYPLSRRQGHHRGMVSHRATGRCRSCGSRSARLQGRALATGTFCDFDNALHFIGSDRIVYRMSRCADAHLQSRHRRETGGKHDVSAVRLLLSGPRDAVRAPDSGNVGVRHIVTGEWHERRTFGLTNWVAAVLRCRATERRCSVRQWAMTR